MNVMDIMKKCVKNSCNSKNVTAIVTLDSGKEYKLRDMCELGDVEESRQALFFLTNGRIYYGYTDGEKYEDEDGRVCFNIKKDREQLWSISMPERLIYGWTYDSDYKISFYNKVKYLINRCRLLIKRK